MSKEKIEFEPIPQPGGGQVCLSIYKPGTFFGRDGRFAVFVGGCGWGHSDTLKAAKALLLDCARAYCTRQMQEATAKLDYYRGQLARLEQGLPPRVKGE